MTAPTTPPMTMNRVIHAAVRRDLARLDAALGSFRDGDRARARGLGAAFANLRAQLTHHHEGEDGHVWPALGGLGADAELLRTMETEHEAMAAALADADAAVATFVASASAAGAAAARTALSRARTVTEQHLAHEESDVEPLLVQHEHTPEWKAVEKALRSLPPGDAGRFFAWLTDGMEPQHRAYLRSTVPAPVVAVLSRVLGRRYHREVAPVWR
jgi:hypothetical protein